MPHVENVEFRPASPPLPLKHWACLPCSASGRPKRSRSVPFSPKPSTAGSGPGRAVERRCTIVRKTGRRQVQVIAIHFREPQRRNAVPQGTRADQDGVGRHRHRHPSPPRAVQLSADVPLFHDPSRDVPALRDAACAGRRYRDALAGLPDCRTYPPGRSPPAIKSEGWSRPPISPSISVLPVGRAPVGGGLQRRSRRPVSSASRTRCSAPSRRRPRARRESAGPRRARRSGGTPAWWPRWPLRAP